MFNRNIDLSKPRAEFTKRRLAVVKNVLTKSGQSTLIDEATRIKPFAKRNLNLMQVHSGDLHKLKSLFLSFAKSKELENIVSSVVGEKVSVCEGSKDETYSLYKSDFGTKVNFYDGDNRSGIGWHFDKNNSWKSKTYVVIYTILLREDIDSPPSVDNVPATYEIVENWKRIQFVIPENAIHIHDTDKVYHKASAPTGWKRWIFILHFTKSPCEPNPKRVGFTFDLIARNVLMKTYVELFIEHPLVTVSVLIFLLLLIK